MLGCGFVSLPDLPWAKTLMRSTGNKLAKLKRYVSRVQGCIDPPKKMIFWKTSKCGRVLSNQFFSGRVPYDDGDRIEGRQPGPLNRQIQVLSWVLPTKRANPKAKPSCTHHLKKHSSIVWSLGDHRGKGISICWAGLFRWDRQRERDCYRSWSSQQWWSRMIMTREASSLVHYDTYI